MKRILTFIILIISSDVFSQHVIFYRNYNTGTLGHGLYSYITISDTTANGNLLAVGSQDSWDGPSYLYAEIDRNGNVIWRKDSAIYGYLNRHDAAIRQGRILPDNNLMFCGYLTDVNVGQTQDIFILKTDSSGNEIWRRTFQKGVANDMIVAADSSVYICGNCHMNGFPQIFLMKLDLNGNTIFFRQ